VVLIIPETSLTAENVEHRLQSIGLLKENKGKAIEHYQKFLSLWKDADPGIAEVKDARKRLSGLKD